jgi:hypothetical protein
MREWGETKLAATEWLRFQIPESVLPIELERAVVSLTIRAPSRSVEILGVADGQPVVVTELTHPIGTYRSILDRQDLLQLDNRGGLVIAVRVGKEESADPLDLMAQASWKIESVGMDIVGKVKGE